MGIQGPPQGKQRHSQHPADSVGSGEGMPSPNPHPKKELLLLLLLSRFSSVQLCDPMDRRPARFLYLWDSPGKNTGVGCCCLIQGIFLTQGLNLHLLHLLALANRFFTMSAIWALGMLLHHSSVSWAWVFRGEYQKME